MKLAYSNLPILTVILAATLAANGETVAQTAAAIPPSLTTPDRVETRIGTLEFKDGAPTVETAEKVRDTLDFTRALDVYNNSFRGASAYAIGKGLQGIGAEDNTPVIYSELMDAKSLFLTANADTIYYFAMVNLLKGPMVVEQPPKGLGTINDMWFFVDRRYRLPRPRSRRRRQVPARAARLRRPAARRRLLHRALEDQPRDICSAIFPGQQRSQANR